MYEVIYHHPEVIEAADEAVRRLGVEPVHTIIRGGTDGARLSHAGCRRRTSSPAAPVPLTPRVGKRAGHGGRGGDVVELAQRLGRARGSFRLAEGAGVRRQLRDLRARSR